MSQTESRAEQVGTLFPGHCWERMEGSGHSTNWEHDPAEPSRARGLGNKGPVGKEREKKEGATSVTNLLL